ncbi:FG-GAP-like repeat-containing protein, partial [Weissella cibaria]|uniref:FG-GAP-like repeat-containing protein n=1 Tax=Weissella cibaria TaxID=137591 RepID=UPI0016BAB098
GLGSHASVDLEVVWPSGQVQVLSGVAANQRLTVVEPTGAAGTLFTDVSIPTGVTFVHDGGIFPDADMGIGTGAAWGDFDGDGDLDLYITNRGGANALYINNGDGTFTDEAAIRGAADAAHDGAGVAAADYDNDGDLDLFLANSTEDVLLRNSGNGIFFDVT